MAAIATALNNAKLVPAVKNLTCLLDLVRQIVGLIESDLENGITITAATKNALSAFLDKLVEFDDVQMGFFLYDSELCTITVTFAVPLKGKNFDEMTLCTIDLTTIKDLFDEYLNNVESEYSDDIQDELTIIREFENELCRCLEKIGVIRTVDKEDDNDPKVKNLVVRNWMFNGPAGAANVGFIMDLVRIDDDDDPSRRLMCRFRKDENVTIDQIANIKLLLYSDNTLDLGIFVEECTVGGSTTELHPILGTGDTVSVTAVGANGHLSCPTAVDFVFNPPLVITESTVAVSLVNFNVQAGLDADVGVYQVIVNSS